MKKIIAALVAVILLLSSAAGEAIDLTSMSTEELQVLQDKITSELFSRSKTKLEDGKVVFYPNEKFVVFDTPEYKVYFTGTGHDQGSRYDFDIVFENNSEYEVCLKVKDEKLNGWKIKPSNYTFLDPGEKKQDRYIVGFHDANIEDASQIQELSFNMYIEQKGKKGYKTVLETGVITATFDPSYWE